MTNMLITPIFHSNFLATKKNEIQRNTSQTATAATSTKFEDENPNSEAAASSRYNLFKTALNRGTELIRNTFLLKSTNYYPESNLSTASTAAATSTQMNGAFKIIKEPLKATPQDDSSSSSPSSSSSSESCSSSPDSIKTELTYFKPIHREIRSASCSTKIIRIPTVRSTSTSSVIHSPCPSPFFIPIAPKRHSAFSFVHHQTNPPEIDGEEEEKMGETVYKSPSNKRRNSKKQSGKEFEQVAPKRHKQDKLKHETRQMLESDNINKRETRSMKKSKAHEEEVTTVINQKKEFKEPPAKMVRKVSSTKKVSTTNKAPTVMMTDSDSDVFRRVTRSMKN